MSGNTRSLPAVTGKPSDRYTKSVRVQEFVHRLRALMAEKNLSQSDLAMRAFGPTTEKGTGYQVAKKRDRISAYVRGEQFPSDPHLEAIAEALCVKKTDLVPDVVPEFQSSVENSSDAGFQVQQIPGRKDSVKFHIGGGISFDLAHLMGLLIIESKENGDDLIRELIQRMREVNQSRHKVEPQRKVEHKVEHKVERKVEPPRNAEPERKVEAPRREVEGELKVAHKVETERKVERKTLHLNSRRTDPEPLWTEEVMEEDFLNLSGLVPATITPIGS
jgi:transcriptional regulator with XRE-family HTH domain